METPLVSFIIAYHDEPVHLLKRSIESIMALSLQSTEREIIVVDDGSHVSPMKALSPLAPHVVYVAQENSGLSVARNTGIELAKGRYIQFVDADDCLIAPAYNHCLCLLRTHQPDMVMFLHTDHEKPQLTFTDSGITTGTAYMQNHNLHASACGYLFGRNLRGELRFTPGIYHEDEEFTPQLLLQVESLLCTDAHAYLYCRRPDSITTSTYHDKRTKRLDDLHAVVDHLHMLAPTLPPLKCEAIQRRTAQLTMDYIYQVICQTRCTEELHKRLGQLKANGLFPLPKADYTYKYKWFRRMTLSPLGLALLMRLLPLMRKER